MQRNGYALFPWQNVQNKCIAHKCKRIRTNISQGIAISKWMAVTMMILEILMNKINKFIIIIYIYNIFIIYNHIQLAAIQSNSYKDVDTDTNRRTIVRFNGNAAGMHWPVQLKPAQLLNFWDIEWPSVNEWETERMSQWALYTYSSQHTVRCHERWRKEREKKMENAISPLMH